MTETEACELGQKFIRANNCAVTGIESARLFKAGSDPFSDSDRGDFWVVIFSRKFPSDVIEFPGEIIVEVECDSKQVSFVTSR